jgi:hypothetical protein
MFAKRLVVARQTKQGKWLVWMVMESLLVAKMYETM